MIRIKLFFIIIFPILYAFYYFFKRYDSDIDIDQYHVYEDDILGEVIQKNEGIDEK